MEATMKTLLKNAKIYDGTGADAFVGDILIEDDRIADIGVSLGAEADRVIDLAGKAAAPGFIDMHSHNDWFVIRNEPMPYFEPFIRQGVTSFVTGNCGLQLLRLKRTQRISIKSAADCSAIAAIRGECSAPHPSFLRLSMQARPAISPCSRGIAPHAPRWQATKTEGSVTRRSSACSAFSRITSKTARRECLSD